MKLTLGAFSISLAVKDIAASRAFYEKLGFEQVAGDQSQNWLILRNGETTIGLFQGMFERNMLTFNPGWTGQAETLTPPRRGPARTVTSRGPRAGRAAGVRRPGRTGLSLARSRAYGVIRRSFRKRNDAEGGHRMLQPISTGLVTAVVGYASAFTVALTGLQAVGASRGRRCRACSRCASASRSQWSSSPCATGCRSRSRGRRRAPRLLAATGPVAGGFPAAVGAFLRLRGARAAGRPGPLAGPRGGGHPAPDRRRDAGRRPRCRCARRRCARSSTSRNWRSR